MKQLLTARTLALAVALGTTLLVAAAQAATTSQSRNRKATGALVGLKKTALGTILVDARGRSTRRRRIRGAPGSRGASPDDRSRPERPADGLWRSGFVSRSIRTAR